MHGGKAKKQKRRQGRQAWCRRPGRACCAESEVGLGDYEAQSEQRAGCRLRPRSLRTRVAAAPGPRAGKRRTTRGPDSHLHACPARPQGDDGSLGQPVGEVGNEAWKTRLVNLVQSQYHRTHPKRGSWHSFCVHRLTLFTLGDLCKCVSPVIPRTRVRRAAAAAVIHY